MAAPSIHPNTSTDRAEVFDLAHARYVREETATPEAIRTEWELAKSELADRYKGRLHAAIRNVLYLDLATWPETFRRRLGDPRDPSTYLGHLVADSDDAVRWRPRRHGPVGYFDHFREQREQSTRSYVHSEPDACVCGCVGFNGALVEHVREVRRAAGNLRAAKAAYHRRELREWVRERQLHLLEFMWLRGVRKIDRKQLAEHLADATRAEVEHRRASIKAARKRARECRERLRDGTYLRHGKGHRAGDPLTSGAVESFKRQLRSAQEWERECRAALEGATVRLDDPAGLVRDWMACSRAPLLKVSGRGHRYMVQAAAVA